MKKILIGLSVGLGVVAVTTTVTLTTIHFVKKNKKPQTPSLPSGDEKEKLKQEFMTALENSTFTKPIKFDLEVTKVDNQVEAIIAALQTKWSGKANLISIKQVGSEYVVTLNSNTNTYTNNIFKNVWANILDESDNIDFKNIKQVNYGFRIVQQNDSHYKLVPTYTQVAFVTKPTWLDENQESVRVSLLKNKDLISTINIQ